MANFDAQITDLIGGTIDQTACDQWATDACKEIINQLPIKLQAKCSAATTLSNSPTVMDMDAVGEILFVTRLSADSSGFQVSAREIDAKYGGQATDSTDLNYFGTATDPVYWIDGNTSDAATLYVKPTPTANQTSIVHHISYPTVNVSDVSVIANFPDEAEFLVVLYVAIRQLLQYQSTMSSSFNSAIGTALTAATQGLANTGTEIGLANKEVDDALIEIDEAVGLTDGAGSNIQVALDAMKTANAKFRADGSDPALFGDESTYTTGNSAMTKVKTSLDNAISLIGLSTAGDKYAAAYDLEAIMSDIDTQLSAEDTELGASRMQQAQTQMAAVGSHLSVAQAHISEWNTMVQTLVAEVNAFASEAGSRYGWISTKATVWQGELSAAQGYMATANGYISQTNGFIAEANARLQMDSTKYGWYGDQYTKLSAEYTRGLTALKGA